MTNWMKLTVYIAATLTSTEAFAQNASIHGTVVDEATRKKLASASVLVVGTSLGASTNLDGEYTVSNIPPGKYDVRFSFLGYEKKTLPGIVVKADAFLELNVGIRPLRADVSAEAFTIEDLRVTAERVLSTDAAVLVDRLRAATIGDAISAEQISKSPDATSSDALKRVTGLSVVDDKFVYIRGVTDRYNATSLNGISVTGTDTDTDRKSFAFDIVPAPLLANTVVTKTVTPDLPGDFSGGIVQLKTLDFPSERIITLTAGGTYVEDTSKKPILTGQGGSKDKWGQDDGTRALPPGDLQGNALVQALPNSWAALDDEARYNSKYTLALGDRFGLGSQEIGFVGALSYNTSWKTTDFLEEPYYGSQPLFSYKGTRYKYEVLWGGILDLSYKPFENHTFRFNNTYNQVGEETVSQSEGQSEGIGYTRQQSIEWDERNFYMGKGGGDHTFTFLNDLQFDWNFHGSLSEAGEPDRKYIQYSESEFQPGLFLLGQNYRTWGALEEKSVGFAANVTYPLYALEDAKIKVGVLDDHRERRYEVEAWTTDTSKLSFQNLRYVTYAVDSIFAPDHYGPNEFFFIPVSVFTGEYTGTHDLLAYYAMADLPFRVWKPRFRLTGGVRIEDSDQVVTTEEAVSQDPVVSQIDEKDPLPSVNLTYLINQKTNLRLAYSEAVNRPEFREMSSVLYFDFDKFQNVIGNPNLKRAQIRNYDVRLEFFPSVSQILAVSYFSKDFTDAIEERLIPSPDKYVRTWFNSPHGTNTGYELEVRKSLGFIGAPVGLHYLQNFMFNFNYTNVESEIEYTEQKTDVQGQPHTYYLTRPMEGQAPWMVNVGFLFVEPRIGLTANILYNRIGRRLEAVGETRENDVYEEERDLIDFALTQNFLYGTRVKFTIKDLLAEDLHYTSTSDRTTYSKYQAATEYGISFSYTF
jgi:hypothetical protein